MGIQGVSAKLTALNAPSNRGANKGALSDLLLAGDQQQILNKISKWVHEEKGRGLFSFESFMRNSEITPSRAVTMDPEPEYNLLAASFPTGEVRDFRSRNQEPKDSAGTPRFKEAGRGDLDPFTGEGTSSDWRDWAYDPKRDEWSEKMNPYVFAAGRMIAEEAAFIGDWIKIQGNTDRTPGRIFPKEPSAKIRRETGSDYCPIRFEIDGRDKGSRHLEIRPGSTDFVIHGYGMNFHIPRKWAIFKTGHVFDYNLGMGMAYFLDSILNKNELDVEKSLNEWRSFIRVGLLKALDRGLFKYGTRKLTPWEIEGIDYQSDRATL